MLKMKRAFKLNSSRSIQPSLAYSFHLISVLSSSLWYSSPTMNPFHLLHFRFFMLFRFHCASRWTNQQLRRGTYIASHTIPSIHIAHTPPNHPSHLSAAQFLPILSFIRYHFNYRDSSLPSRSLTIRLRLLRFHPTISAHSSTPLIYFSNTVLFFPIFFSFSYPFCFPFHPTALVHILFFPSHLITPTTSYISPLFSTRSILTN